MLCVRADEGPDGSVHFEDVCHVTLPPGSLANSVALTSGDSLWVCGANMVHVIDTVTASVTKSLAVSGATSLETIAIVHVHGKETVWIGDLNRVVMFDAKRKVWIKSEVDHVGRLGFVQEVGENMVYLGINDGSKTTGVYLWDMHA